jgi:glycerol-3-phosphate dehydrogenase subunit B
MTDKETAPVDLTVIGAGMAGMAAALFAANRGLSVAQVGSSAEIIFASGLLDLLGVHPMATGRLWQDPWAAVDALRRDLPQHPYARLSNADIQGAFTEFCAFLTGAGLPYWIDPGRNTPVLTSLGTAKLTYALPLTMQPGVAARAAARPCLIAAVKGLEGFSARQLAVSLALSWPQLRTATVAFPGAIAGEVFPEKMARAMELRPHLDGAEVVGLPAILGVTRCRAVAAALSAALERPVFEIPSIPPSVPGLRLKETCEQHLPRKGVRLFLEQRVTAVQPRGEAGFVLQVTAPTGIQTRLACRSLLLATGRFLGAGLRAERSGIREALLDLPVFQPQERRQWHRRDFLDLRGHPVNQAGIETDRHFRPLDASGRPAFTHLFAAGAILAHQDWVRMKCGSGLALATALAAVRACRRALADSLE